MKFIKYICIILIYTSNCFAQPGVKPNVTVDIQTMFSNKTQIFVKGDGSIQNNTIYLRNKKGLKDVWIHTVVKIDSDYDIFIYKKDTMRIKIILPKYYDLGNIHIKKLNLIKGNFTIYFLEYVKQTKKQKIYNSYQIDNFPEDCLAYRKEEEVKNKK